MVELLAPAGNLPMVEGAVANGANAIYVGPRGWSRRRDKYEMPDEDVRAAIGIAHKRRRQAPRGVQHEHAVPRGRPHA